jgi:hypothetical protein
MTMPINEEILEKKREDRKFQEWRRNVKAHLPNLSQRIFALRGINYYGCGFHYQLEADLGKVIYEINNVSSEYYHDKEYMINRIILNVLVESLFDRLIEIEGEINNNKQKN